jgi:multidrug resistance protein, MATE family
MRPLTEDLRELVKLMVPLALVQVGYTALGFVDTTIAGLAGGETIAAVGLGAGIFYTLAVVGNGLALAVDPLVSQALGANDPTHARRVMWNGIYVAAFATIPITLVMFAIAFSLRAFGVAESLAHDVTLYLVGRAPSLFPFLVAVTLRGYLQASHRPASILWAVLVANLLNGPGSYFLLKQLGACGVGLAAAVGTLGQMLVLVVAVRKGPAGTRTLSRPIVNRLFKIGAPIGLQLLAEVGAFLFVGILMARLSSTAMAGHQVAIMFASVTFSVCVGMGSATSVQVGRAIGGGDHARARRSGIMGIILGATVMCIPSVVMAIAPEALIHVMTRDPDVVSAAVLLLRIAAVFQIVDGVQALGAGALRGAGMTRTSFMANLVGHWAVGLPLALFLAFGLNLGPGGLWWGLTIGLAVVAVWLTWAFLAVSKRPIAALSRDFL